MHQHGGNVWIHEVKNGASTDQKQKEFILYDIPQYSNNNFSHFFTATTCKTPSEHIHRFINPPHLTNVQT